MKKSTKKTPKLSLRTEKLLHLSPQKLARVVGGDSDDNCTSYSDTCSPTH